MIAHHTHIRVRYADTDQMGFVYHGKYVEYFEVGRVELIRQLGISYKEIEARGIWMPVADLQLSFKRPAHYDELLSVHTRITEKPRASLLTHYQLTNGEGELKATGSVRLAFIDHQHQKPVRVPDFMLEAVERHWAPATG